VNGPGSSPAPQHCPAFSVADLGEAVVLERHQPNLEQADRRCSNWSLVPDGPIPVGGPLRHEETSKTGQSTLPATTPVPKIFARSSNPANGPPMVVSTRQE
jgi:hypothetical protein